MCGIWIPLNWSYFDNLTSLENPIEQVLLQFQFRKGVNSPDSDLCEE